MLQMGIEFVPDRSIKQIIEMSKLAEEVGFDHIWITDHYNNRNLWVTVTAIALNTERVIIGPGVTNPYHTSPALSAAAIVTVNEISGGRAAIGLGAGDKITLDDLGIKWTKPVTTVLEGIRIIRELTQGERVSFNGNVFQIKGAKLTHVKKKPVVQDDGSILVVNGKEVKQAPKIPIYAGVQGPEMLERTAEIVDGLLINASHPRDFDEAMKRIKIGVERSQRDIREIDIGAYTAFSIAPTLEEAKGGDLKLVVGFIVAGSPKIVLDRHGLDSDKCQEVTDTLAQGRMNDLDKVVTDEMIDAFAVVGNTRQCLDRIEDLVKTGVTQLIVGSPIGPDKIEAIKQIGREIIPNISEF
ncbi:MAG: LLM class flavin-dependent oxidoreductase [Candidatus Thorarchaeota archaeon]|nr:LLM class flavin-dependent oxidoreductase [Candidatus Thorarchaeota archaeon]